MRTRLDRKGVATIEFALVAPVMVIILLATIELSNVFRIQARVNTATGVLAATISASPSVTAPSGSLADDCVGAAFNLAPYPTATFSADIVSITNDHPSARVTGSTDSSTVTTYLDWENRSSCMMTSPTTMSLSGAYASSNSPTSLLTKSGAPAVTSSDLGYSYSVIVVRTTYQYQNVVTFLLGRTISLTGTAMVRPRSNGTIPCTNVAGTSACPSLQ